MIHRIYYMLGFLWLVLRWSVKLLFLHRLHWLGLHGGLCLLRQYDGLEAAPLHHLTLDNLQSVLFPLLVELISIFKLLWIWHLYVLNHTFLTDLPHHLFGHSGYLGFERADFFEASLLLLGALLLLLRLRVVPVNSRLVELLIGSASLIYYQLTIFVNYGLVWVLLFLILLVFLISFLQIDLFLLFHQDILIALMEWARVSDLNLLSQLLFCGLRDQLLTEGGQLFFHNVLSSAIGVFI